MITDLGQVEWPRGMLLQSDGKILIGLASGPAYDGPWSFVLLRYDSSGLLDPSFSEDGILISELPWRGILQAIAIAPDGKIVPIGMSKRGYYYNGYTVVRYNSDDSIDTAFSDDGMVEMDVDGFGTEPYSVVIDRSGRIIVAGA